MTLDETVGNQMKDTRSLIERISMYIPIYRGYKEKNLRRDEDRAIRDEVARSLEGTKADLGTIQREVIGDMDTLRDAERIRAKADRYCISVKKAVGGYSGFHDSVKIMESELDSLIRWDAALIEGTQKLRSESAAIIDMIDSGNKDVKVPLRSLERTIDQMQEAYNERETVMKGFREE